MTIHHTSILLWSKQRGIIRKKRRFKLNKADMIGEFVRRSRPGQPVAMLICYQVRDPGASNIMLLSRSSIQTSHPAA